MCWMEGNCHDTRRRSTDAEAQSPPASCLVGMIKSLTDQCSTEELRIQTLQGTIRHKMSEYPIVAARLSEIDHQAIDLYNTIMDSRAVPVDTSPTFRPFDLPSPSSME